jgi:hypothetical protein
MLSETIKYLMQEVQERESRVKNFQHEIKVLMETISVLQKNPLLPDMNTHHQGMIEGPLTVKPSYTGRIYEFLEHNGPARTDQIRKAFPDAKAKTIYSVLSNKRRFRNDRDGRWHNVTTPILVSSQ